MFETLKRLYANKLLDEKKLKNAVNMGWITKEQFEEILKGESHK